jgi:membrane protein involved in colicin uptake
LAFRRALREQADAEAKLRRQREEAQRQAEEDTQREIEAYTRAEETLNSMSQNDRDLLRQKVTREYLKRYPSARHMLDFESWIRRMMIREIVKKPGGFSR